MSAAPSPSRAAIEAAIADVLREPGAPDVVSACQFGSVAESGSHRESDVDRLAELHRHLEAVVAIETDGPRA